MPEQKPKDSKNRVNAIIRFVPCTPAGTLLFNLESKTKKQAIRKLMKEAWYMPYDTWGEFVERGYTIEQRQI